MKINPRGKYKHIRDENGKLIKQHRYVLHQIDPRPNENELEVHHIDGDKSNNDPSNLMWMSKSDHMRLHHLGENHFPCSGTNSANYRHGMCMGGKRTKEYVQYHNHKTYMKHREQRLAKQNEYGAMHRDHKRWYDKVRHWTKQLELASTEERRTECINRLNALKEVAI